MIDRTPRLTAIALTTLVAASGAVASLLSPQAPQREPARQRAPQQSPPQAATQTIRVIGSSAVAPVLSLWTDAYRQRVRNVTFAQTSGWTTIAIPALVDGTADLAPMSRPPRSAEIQAFRDAFGYEPLVIEIATDAVAVFVHRDNPLPSISMTQLDAIYSSTRRREGEPIGRWSALGVPPPLADQPIRTFGFSSFAIGSSVLRERVLLGGDFASELSVEPGPSAVVNAVGSYRNAIGYASQSVTSRRARIVPISVDGAPPVAPTAATVGDGSYPLGYTLYIALNRRPGTAIDPGVRGFLEFLLSDQGQSIVGEAQLIPLAREARVRELAKLR